MSNSIKNVTYYPYLCDMY